MPIQTQFPASFFGTRFREKLEQLMAKFETPEGDSILVLRKGISDEGASYHILMGLGTKALHFPVGYFSNFNPDAEAPEIGDYGLVGVTGGIPIDDTLMSGPWTVISTYSRTSTPGAYAEYTTPDGVTEIGCWDLSGVEAAVALVEIDGDRTLATTLPTAQELVDAERLDSSVLTTHGGTLSPTDRILDAANATSTVAPAFLSFNRQVRFVSGLVPGQHTVRVTHTGYRPLGGTSDFVRLAGFWFDDPLATIADIPIAMPTPIIPNPIAMSGSDINFAFNFKPTGGSFSEWMGHSGTQFTIAAELYVDDELVSPILVDDPYKHGSKAELRVSGYCRHPESVENVAQYTQSFTFDPKKGIELQHDFTWLVSGEVTGYIPQFSVNNALSRGSLLESNEDYDLAADDGGGYGSIAASAAYLWTPGGNWAALCCVPNYATNAMGEVWIQDRLGGGLNKIYFERYSGDTVNPGDRIQLKATYRLKEFTNVDAELGRD